MAEKFFYDAGSDIGINTGDTSTFKCYENGNTIKIEIHLTMNKPTTVKKVGEIYDNTVMPPKQLTEAEIMLIPGRIHFPKDSVENILGSPTGNITYESATRRSIFHLTLPIGNSGKTQSGQ